MTKAERRVEKERAKQTLVLHDMNIQIKVLTTSTGNITKTTQSEF